MRIEFHTETRPGRPFIVTEFPVPPSIGQHVLIDKVTEEVTRVTWDPERRLVIVISKPTHEETAKRPLPVVEVQRKRAK